MNQQDPESGYISTSGSIEKLKKFNNTVIRTFDQINRGWCVRYEYYNDGNPNYETNKKETKKCFRPGSNRGPNDWVKNCEIFDRAEVCNLNFSLTRRKIYGIVRNNLQLLK